MAALRYPKSPTLGSHSPFTSSSRVPETQNTTSIVQHMHQRFSSHPSLYLTVLATCLPFCWSIFIGNLIRKSPAYASSTSSLAFQACRDVPRPTAVSSQVLSDSSPEPPYMDLCSCRKKMQPFPTHTSPPSATKTSNYLKQEEKSHKNVCSSRANPICITTDARLCSAFEESKAEST
jgi:hypothetical protein